MTKNIKTKPPEEHKKTYREFGREIGKQTKKADFLLKIFKIEKNKRGVFTYNIKSEANLHYAQESVGNAQTFVSVINSIIYEKMFN